MSSNPIPNEHLTLVGDKPIPEQQVKGNIVTDHEERKVKDISTVQLAEYTLFTMAPVYWMVGVPFDITVQFLRGCPEAKSLKLGLPRQIINVPGWTHIIEAMDTQHFDKFANFMGEIVFQKSGNLSSVCGDYLDLPYSLSGQSRIAVFTPRGLLFRFKPGVDPEGNIVLYQTTPDGRGKIGELTDGIMEGLKYAGDTH